MLVGTFQIGHVISARDVANEIERLTGIRKVTKPDYPTSYILPYVQEQFLFYAEQERPYQKELGFKPVWFFPMSSAAEAFAHASLVAVQDPWHFFLYDIPIEEFMKIDVVKQANTTWSYVKDVKRFLNDHHWLTHLSQRLKANPEYNKNRNPLNLLTDSTDMSEVYLLIDDKKLDKYKPLYVFPVNQFRIENKRQALVGYYKPKKSLWLAPEYNKGIKKIGHNYGNARQITEFYHRAEPFYREWDYVHPPWVRIHNSGAPMYAIGLGEQYRKEDFVWLDAAPLWHFANAIKDGNRPNLWANARPHMKYDFDKYNDLRQRYLDLTGDGVLTHEEYHEIFDGLKSLVICHD